MKPRLVVAFALLASLLAAGGGAADSGAGVPEGNQQKPGHCGCAAGKACWHWLRAPFRVPEDPCRCGVCASGSTCSMTEHPAGWSLECINASKPECFWKRHAASWGITCSKCAADTECAACDGLPGAPDAKKKAALAKQMGIEFSETKDEALRRRQAVGWSAHFYIATDIGALKVLSQSGAPRIIDAHEVIHLFLQRAEQAYDDFVAVWGNDIRLDKPMAIYMAVKSATTDAWRARYFGGADTQFVFAGAEGKIGGGFCWNGFAVSLDDYKEDRDLHAYVRHMIGHILFSCWHGVGGFQQECPKWAFVGAADWLCKIHPFFKGWTTFCHDEGGAASGSGERWDEKARAIAGGKRTPIEKLFGIPSMSHLTYEDHIRAWSYMSTMLDEDRARWLAVMRGIRERKEHAAAFRAGLGMTPDEFDARWAARMLGSRKTMLDLPKDAADLAASGGADAADRRRILSEQDPSLLAAHLRGLERVRDVRTAQAALSRVAIDSDLVRETVVMLLEKTQAPEVVAWLRTEGLGDPSGLARGHVARVLATLKDAAARPALEAMLSDSHWLARANAALALGRIADPQSVAPLVAKLDDPNPKAWIAKADALAGYGKAASAATPGLVAKVKAVDWQVRLTACRALAAVGTEAAVEPLIERLEEEGGRLQREIWLALRALTNESFGTNPDTWRKWWRTQKPRGLDPPPPTVKNPEDERYAPAKRPEEPAYYGRRMFSKSVLFVLDISRSMETTIEVAPDAQKKLGTLPSGPRLLVAKTAIQSAIRKLDPRTKFNIVYFSTNVRPWKDGLVLADAYRDAALSSIDATNVEDETNIFGALRAAVGLHGKPTLSADLDPIPDSIYFLTDGTPTRGEITDKETILSWMRDVNRFAKVDLHVIAMGSLGLDLPFLAELAKQNHGEFIHVPDRAN